MQQPLDNVIDIRQYGGSPSPRGTNLLSECAEMATLRMSDIFQTILGQTADEMLAKAKQPQSTDVYQIYMEAGELARDKPAEVVASFKRIYFQKFKRSGKLGQQGHGASQAFDLSELSLVEADDLEETLATNTLANAIHNACGEELFSLGHRMGVLLNEPNLAVEDNPLGPENISQAMLEAIKEHCSAVKPRLMLATAFTKRLPTDIRELYQDINTTLRDKGVLPNIRVGLRKDAHSGSSTSTPNAAQAGSTAPQDLYGLLQQLVSLGQPGAGQSGMGLPAGFPHAEGSVPGASMIAVPAALMQSLTHLQHGETDGFANLNLEAAQLTSGQTNIIREIKSSSVASGIGAVDGMTLDLVALVFDYILDDRRIPDSMKALIGRLQIPLLKVAMMDRNFFAQKSHPARRLLDVLAEAAMGWQEEEGHEGGLYQKVQEVVHQILNRFEDDISLFTEILEDFQQYVKDEQKKIAEITAQRAKVLQGREQEEIARIVAHDEVLYHVMGQRLSEGMRAFFFNQWETYLSRLYLQDGEGSEPWLQAIATMENLIWSVQAKQTAEDRKRLVALLPSMLKQIDSGLKAIETDQTVRDAFFSALVKCHAAAVKAGLSRDDNETPSMPESPMQAGDEPPIPVLTEFVDIPLPTEPVEAEPQLVEEIAVADILGGGEETLPAAFDQHAASDEVVGNLKRGTWIELIEDDGSLTRLKLAWVSPQRGLYLFTSRLGQRAMSISAEGLARKFGEGKIQVMNSAPLMERVVNNLFERLQQNVA